MDGITRLLDKLRQWFGNWVMRAWIWYHLNAYDARRHKARQAFSGRNTVPAPLQDVALAAHT